MKKEMRISIALVLCGLVLVMLPLLKGPGSVRASNLETPTIQVERSERMDAPGAITVSATCPQNYHVQSGKTQIISGKISKYDIQFNGPSAQGTAWTVTVTNKAGSIMAVVVTAICAAT